MPLLSKSETGPFVRHFDVDGDEIDASNRVFLLPQLHEVRRPRGVPPSFAMRPLKHRIKLDFFCKFCSTTFKTKHEWADHEQTHIGTSKPYLCEYCVKCFSSKSQRERHHRTHTGEKPHRCWYCHKRFAEKANLAVHQIVHTGYKPYQCQECGRRYTQRGALRTHIRTHTGERPFKCDLCDKGFKSAGVLKVHMRTHSDEKMFGCEYPNCGGRFKHKSTLVTHVRTHTGEKPYSCESCPKRFADKAALIVHRRRLHSNVRPYRCDLCGKSFSENSSLRRHQSVHTGARNFWCEVCEKGFATSGSRSSHYKTKFHMKNAEEKGTDWTLDDHSRSRSVSPEREQGPDMHQRRVHHQSNSPPAKRMKRDPEMIENGMNGNGIRVYGMHTPPLPVKPVLGMTARANTHAAPPPFAEMDRMVTRSRKKWSAPIANGVPPPPPTSSLDQDTVTQESKPPSMNREDVEHMQIEMPRGAPQDLDMDGIFAPVGSH